MPAPRFAFSTALKSSSDNSSHQIYIMGGIEDGSPVTSVNSGEGLVVETIWVLSIPSFQWTQLPVRSKTTAANPGPRVSSKCQAIGEHYIFCYGGRRALSYSAPGTCDQKANAAFLFDINTLTWTDEFTPNEGTYKIPAEVIKNIGGK